MKPIRPIANWTARNSWWMFIVAFSLFWLIVFQVALVMQQ